MARRVTRREFIGTTVATTAIVGTSRTASSAPAKRPNMRIATILAGTGTAPDPA